MDSTIMIFGGSGFIGTTICKHAIAMGNRVISISPSGNQNVPLNLKHHPQIRWIKADVAETSAWINWLPHIHKIINVIGILKSNSPYKYGQLNVKPTQIILEQIKAFPKLPYVYLSAGRGPLLSMNYLNSKAAAERLINNSNQTTLIIRSGLVVGSKRPWTNLLKIPLSIITHIPVLKKMARINTCFNR